MTRVNCIPPEELSDAHLGAEYRELPRVFRLAYAAMLRGEAPDDPRNPAEYKLGPGHVRFFYPRLSYLVHRFYAIADECQARGRKCTFTVPPAYVDQMPIEWLQQWTPTPEAQALCRERIKERS